VGTDAAVAEGEAGLDPILVPVDFTEHSTKAVEAAKRFLAPSGKLILQHVVSTPVHPSFYAEGVSRLFQVDPELPKRIREKLAELYPGAAEHVVSEGSVVEDILEMASTKKVQMIAMGTRGLSGLDQVLLGSVTERVIQRAKVPVLAVK
ncbi:MAG: universal stress protein, partial [Vicinamibacteria bacterium]